MTPPQNLDTSASREKQIEQLYTQAEVSKAIIDKLGASLQEELGAEYVEVPLKGKKRGLEKVDAYLDGDLTQLTDVARCSLVCDTYEDMLGVSEKLEGQFEIDEKLNTVEDPVDYHIGFRSIKLLTVVEGHITEVQLRLRDIHDVSNGKGHEIYEERSTIEKKMEHEKISKEEMDNFDDLTNQSINLYDDAIEKYNAKTPGIKIKKFREALNDNAMGQKPVEHSATAGELDEKLDTMKSANPSEPVVNSKPAQMPESPKMNARPLQAPQPSKS